MGETAMRVHSGPSLRIRDCTIAALAQRSRASRCCQPLCPRHLEALEALRPKCGRQVTPERLQARLAEIDSQLADDPKPMKRLAQMQDRRDLEVQLGARDDEPDMTAVEQAFIEHAASFASRRGIAYATWREAGVSADMLGRAGITRGQ